MDSVIKLKVRRAPTKLISKGAPILFKVTPGKIHMIGYNKINLTIIANGTYEPPEGSLFERVVVNVPIPSNYGLITRIGDGIMVS